MKAIDINLNEVKSEGVAYFRLTKEAKEFLEVCEKKHGIIGFEWDSESPWNFGVILNKKEEK